MIYQYTCKTKDCENNGRILNYDVPMKDIGKFPLYCKTCKKPLQRVYTAPKIKTSDGFK